MSNFNAISPFSHVPVDVSESFSVLQRVTTEISVNDAVSLIRENKEFFDAIKSRRFISTKAGMVKNGAGKDIYLSKEDSAQYGSNWKRSRFANWLEKSSTKINSHFKEFWDSLNDKKAVKINTNYFLTEILGAYIKLDRTQQPTVAAYAEEKLKTYLNLHPEFVEFLNSNKELLTNLNKQFVQTKTTPSKRK